MPYVNSITSPLRHFTPPLIPNIHSVTTTESQADPVPTAAQVAWSVSAGSAGAPTLRPPGLLGRLFIVAVGVVLGVLALVVLIPLMLLGVVALIGFWLYATVKSALAGAKKQDQAGRVNVRVLRPDEP